MPMIQEKNSKTRSRHLETKVIRPCIPKTEKVEKFSRYTVIQN